LISRSYTAFIICVLSFLVIYAKSEGCIQDCLDNEKVNFLIYTENENGNAFVKVCLGSDAVYTEYARIMGATSCKDNKQILLDHSDIKYVEPDGEVHALDTSGSVEIDEPMISIDLNGPV